MWPVIDGELQRSGVDLEERACQPGYRFFALLHSMVRDRITWAKDEDRKKIEALLDWPEVSEQRTLEESDRMARTALAQLGIVIDFDAVPPPTAGILPDDDGDGNNDTVLETDQAHE